MSIREDLQNFWNIYAAAYQAGDAAACEEVARGLVRAYAKARGSRRLAKWQPAESRSSEGPWKFRSP